MYFFFNDTATTEIYTLSLHDALPISRWDSMSARSCRVCCRARAPSEPWIPIAERAVPSLRSTTAHGLPGRSVTPRSEEHTSELQSRQYLVCRLLLEKKK